MLFNYELGATVYNQTLVTRVEGANPQRNADNECSIVVGKGG